MPQIPRTRTSCPSAPLYTHRQAQTQTQTGTDTDTDTDTDTERETDTHTDKDTDTHNITIPPSHEQEPVRWGTLELYIRI
jgi:hypothetical protein